MAQNLSAESSPHPFALSGVASALLIPRRTDGRLDIAAFERCLLFLLQRGIRGFAINGATGEYAITTAEEVRHLLQCARAVLGDAGKMITGVGSPSLYATEDLCAIAVAEGSDGILLPMPYFFPYEQSDLVAFVKALLPALTIPSYIYNLPSFTTPLLPETSVDIIQRFEQIRGIKDSSGSLDTVKLLRQRASHAACILGNDTALHDALAAGACDGVVSGVSCVLPELMCRHFAASSADPTGPEALELKRRLDDFIEWLGRFPVPWGLKIIAEARGLGEAFFSLPLSVPSREARKQFETWFDAHRAELFATDDTVQ